MITEQDLREAIAECQGQRNPTSNTCVKLAAYYALLDRMTDNSTGTPILPTYSYADSAKESSEIVNYQNDSEFAKIISGMDTNDVWPVLNELMDVLHDTNKRLYNAVIRRLTQVSGKQ